MQLHFLYGSILIKTQKETKTCIDYETIKLTQRDCSFL